LIGFGSLVGPLSHSVLYLPTVLARRSPSSDFGENQLSRGLISLSLLLTSHLRIFQHPRVRSFTACYRSFNLLISRSPPLRVYCLQLCFRAVRTRFPFASTAFTQLRLATDNNSQTHYAKGRRSPLPSLDHAPRDFHPKAIVHQEGFSRLSSSLSKLGRGSHTLYANGCRVFSLP
jgi:hypothetical protein